MDEREYFRIKEIVEELLYKDRYFFSQHSLEFNIFRYTSLFAVLTFTFQFLIIVIQNFYGLVYLTYSQLLLLFSSLAGMVVLIELYFGLTQAIRKSVHDKKGVYLRQYICGNCGFTSYSEFYSNLHIVSYPDHTLKGNQILIKLERLNLFPRFLRFLFNNRRRKLKKLNDPELTILSESDRRLKNEITEGQDPIKFGVIGVILLILLAVAYLSYEYLLLKSIILTIFTLVIIFGPIFLVSTYTGIALANEDIDSIYLFKMVLTNQKERETLKIRFKYFKVGTLYWKHVKKGPGMEQIETQDGPLYIINKIVLNKFGELIEVIP